MLFGRRGEDEFEGEEAVYPPESPPVAGLPHPQQMRLILKPGDTSVSELKYLVDNAHLLALGYLGERDVRLMLLKLKELRYHALALHALLGSRRPETPALTTACLEPVLASLVSRARGGFERKLLSTSRVEQIVERLGGWRL